MTKLKKFFRPEHFHLIINVASKEDSAEINYLNLSKRMRELNFITQGLLENLLLNFKFYARAESKTKSHLINFQDQLERSDINRRPHWQLYLNSSAGVLTTRLLIFLLKAITGEEKHPSIQLKRFDDVIGTLEYVTKPGKLELKVTD